jgi:hypothetical protein
MKPKAKPPRVVHHVWTRRPPRETFSLLWSGPYAGEAEARLREARGRGLTACRTATIS